MGLDLDVVDKKTVVLMTLWVVLVMMVMKLMMTSEIIRISCTFSKGFINYVTSLTISNINSSVVISININNPKHHQQSIINQWQNVSRNQKKQKRAAISTNIPTTWNHATSSSPVPAPSWSTSSTLSLPFMAFPTTFCRHRLMMLWITLLLMLLMMSRVDETASEVAVCPHDCNVATSLIIDPIWR